MGRKGLAGLWHGKMDLRQKPGGNLLTLEAHLGGKILEEPWHRVELKQGHRQETKGQLKDLGNRQGRQKPGEASTIMSGHGDSQGKRWSLSWHGRGRHGLVGMARPAGNTALGTQGLPGNGDSAARKSSDTTGIGWLQCFPEETQTADSRGH